MERRVKTILTAILIIILLTTFIIDLSINPSRIFKTYPKEYTAKILGFPKFTWDLVLILEHSVGHFAFGLFFAGIAEQLMRK